MIIELRTAKSSDVRDVVRVLRESRRRFMPYAPLVHTEAEMLAWFETQLLPSGGVTVAVTNEEIVGILAVSHDEDSSWIDHLYIEPCYCGRGIGTKLLQLAASVLDRPIRLYAFQDNRRAREFYERVGFLPIRFSDGSGNEEYCPDVLYELW